MYTEAFGRGLVSGLVVAEGRKARYRRLCLYLCPFLEMEGGGNFGIKPGLATGIKETRICFSR